MDFFTSFGRGETKSLIAGADENGVTVIYDLDERTLHSYLRLNEPKHVDPVSLAVGDALYVIDRYPHPDSRCGFEALVCDDSEPMKSDDLRPTEEDDDGGDFIPTVDDDVSGDICNWHWRCLEPPPYVLEPGYKPSRISAYTVVGGSDIWISTPGIGTYSFDTLAGKWSKAGKWLLPFRGRADYFPEYDSWLGFPAKTGLLCSVDLSTASVRRTRPAAQRVLEEDMQESAGCMLYDAYLVRLGSGKLCVAKFFKREYNSVSSEGHVVRQIQAFAIFTGFVMDQNGPGGALQMRKHKSRRYAMEPTGNGWIF